MSSLADQQQTLERHFASVQGFVERCDWRAARRHAFAAVAAVETLNDVHAMLRAGHYLEKVNEFGIAGHLLAKGGRGIAQIIRTEWDGTDLPNGTLLIEQRIRDIGAPVRYARLSPHDFGFALEVTALLPFRNRMTNRPANHLALQP